MCAQCHGVLNSHAFEPCPSYGEQGHEVRVEGVEIRSACSEHSITDVDTIGTSSTRPSPASIIGLDGRIRRDFNEPPSSSRHSQYGSPWESHYGLLEAREASWKSDLDLPHNPSNVAQDEDASKGSLSIGNQALYDLPSVSQSDQIGSMESKTSTAPRKRTKTGCLSKQ